MTSNFNLPVCWYVIADHWKLWPESGTAAGTNGHVGYHGRPTAHVS